MKQAAWEELFGSPLHSGVYRAGVVRSNSIIIKAALVRNLEVARVDLKNAHGKEGFLKKVAASLNFPGYFGMNWDALADCLNEISGKNAGGRVIIFTGFGKFAAGYASESRMAEKIFRRTAGFWKEENRRFYIILGT
ncbi:MAG: barstar family protein [Dehalococcoidaceae bacterium]|nr:barstar family protein [Dehalococcoidaceae bacterium]